MNRTDLIYFVNTTTSSVSTRRATAKIFVKNPFDSWYIGGILFLSTVMFVLLYANYYRENMFQRFWYGLLFRLGFIPQMPTFVCTSPSIERVNDPFLI